MVSVRYLIYNISLAKHLFTLQNMQYEINYYFLCEVGQESSPEVYPSTTFQELRPFLYRLLNHSEENWDVFIKLFGQAGASLIVWAYKYFLKDSTI